MNEGVLLLVIVLATIGAAVVVVAYRDLIWPASYSTVRRPGRRPDRRPAGRPVASTPTETKPKPATTVSQAVSGIAMPQTDDEMIAFHVLAKLIAADAITETRALEIAFDVRAGSSKAYKRVQAKLKQAQDELTKEAEQIPT